MSENVVTLYTGGARVIYQGDGSTTVFPVTFDVDDAFDLQLFTSPVDDSAEAEILDRDAWNYAAGAVTVASAPDSATKLVIMRATPIERRGRYTAGGMLTADSLNGDLTRLTRIAQDLDERMRLIPGAGVGRVLTGDEVDAVLNLYRMIGSGLVMLTSGGWLARAANGAASLRLSNGGVSVSGGLAVDGGITISNGGVVFQTSGGGATFTSRAAGEWTSGGGAGGYSFAPGGVELHATVSSATGAYTSGGVLSLGASGGKLIFRTLAGESRGVTVHGSGADILGELRANYILAGNGNFSGGVTFASGATVSGGLVVSGGIMVDGKEAADKPWVLAQFGSSGYLQSDGGFVAHGKWTHSSTTSGQVTSVWGVRPVIDFTSGFTVTVYRDSEAPAESSYHFAVNTTDPHGENGAYPGVGHYVLSSGFGAGFSAGVYGGARLFCNNTSVSEVVELTHSGIRIEAGRDGAGYTGAGVNVNLSRGAALAHTDQEGQRQVELLVSGGRVVVTREENGSATSGNVLLNTDPLPGQSGAIIENRPFSTTVGGYTVKLTSGGGLSVSGSGAGVVLSGGQITAGVDAGGSVTINAQGVSIEDGIGGSAAIAAGYLIANGVLIGGRVEVATRLITSTVSEMQPVISVLSGGTSYVFDSEHLYSLEVASVVKTTEASYLHFKLDSVTAPTPVVISGFAFDSAAFEGGKEYLVGFFDGMCVVNEVTSGGVLQ